MEEDKKLAQECINEIEKQKSNNTDFTGWYNCALNNAIKIIKQKFKIN